MMALSFSFIELAQIAEKDPLLMVMWAAFGFPLLALIFSGFLSVLSKLKIKQPMKEDTLLLITSFILIIWLVGFITQMLLLFTTASGLRMLIIWGVMLICYTGFVLLNKRMIIKWMQEKFPSKDK